MTVGSLTIWWSVLFVAVLIVSGLVYVVTSLRSAAFLDAGIDAVNGLRDREGSLEAEVRTILNTLGTNLPADLRETLLSNFKSAESRNLPDALASLELGLKLRRQVLLARTGLSYWLKPSQSSSQAAQTSQEIQSEKEVASTPPKQKSRVFIGKEAELLVGVTEKFYGSAPFKTLSVALTAAVLLAVSGGILIGTQSISLRDNLQKAAETEQKAIKDQSASILGSMNSVKDLADRDKTELEATVKSFREHSEALKREAIQAAISDLSSALAAKAKEFTEPLEAQAKIAAQPLTDVQTRIEQLRTQVSEAEKALTAVSPQIERLKSAAKLGDQIDTIVAKLEVVRSAANNAEKLNADANAAWESFKTLHEGLTQSQVQFGEVTGQLRDQKTQLDKLRNDLADLQKSIDEWKSKSAQLNQLEVDVASANGSAEAARLAMQRGSESADAAGKFLLVIEEDHKKATGLESDVQSRLGAINSQALALEAQVETLKGKVHDLEGNPHPSTPEQVTPPKGPAKPAQLNHDEIKKIQKALADRGFDPKGTDGRLGPNTTEAIKEYQKHVPDHAPADGRLTEEQKADLLSGQ